MERMLDDTYRLLEEIGKGGFGAVFKGVRKGFEGIGPVAIKVLNRNTAMKPKDYARFQREASLMSQLAHPGIVSVFELVQSDTCYYIVMELVSGVNLKEFVVQRGGQLALTDVLEVLIQAADALEYVHGHHIQHRDIKPQNILICDRGTIGEARFQVKIVDFGVARLSPQALGGEASGSQEIVGTFAYMAPEATGLVDYPLDHRCDIYSLGIVAFELIAGRVPFYRTTATEVARAHAFDKPSSLSEVLGREVAPIIEACVAKCMAKNPADRYQSIFGLACDLKRIRDELRANGKLGFFEIAAKDFDISTRFETVYVGHDEALKNVMNVLNTEKGSGRLNWILVRGSAGCGKSRLLDELRRRLEKEEVRYLYLKFSESERRLPYQALAMAVNDYLASFERSRLSELRQLFDELVRRAGADSARHLAALIPVLRPMLEEKMWSESRSLGPLSATPSTVLNQAFKEMFDAMVGGSKRLVFLLDDIQLGDASTIALLTYLLEGMNTGVNFSFVLTKRDSSGTMPVLVEGLLRRAAGLRRRFHELVLPKLNESSVTAYLIGVGVENVTFELVQYFMRRTDASPHQMQLLIKQLIEKGAMLPARSGSGEGRISVDWHGLRAAKIELFSIDALMASLDTLEARDREILIIAAVCQEPTSFELFRLDNEFSVAELEARLLALVHRGLMSEAGDDAMPMSRRKFALTHERIRTALLADLKITRVKEIHLLIATRIRQVYRNPSRSEVLLLAKHVDGAAESHEPKGAAISFMKAARVCIAEGDLNLGRYYLEKAVLRQQLLAEQPVATQLLKEIQEARYMIFAAQGNLVAASEACRSLIEMTADPEKREKLELYWAQLQLSLGRHSVTFQKCAELLGQQFPDVGASLRHRFPLVDWLAGSAESALGHMLMHSLGRRWFASLCSAIGFLGNQHAKRLVRPEATVHCLALMMMAQLHGHEGSLAKTLFIAARLDTILQQTERWGAIIRVLLGALEMRKGYIRAAYRVADKAEQYFTRKGNIESLRWMQSLRSIWYDYPSGRIDRLLQVFGGARAVGYPTSGLLHFETYGLRAWLRLISPSSFSSVDLDRRRDRRRSESRATTAMTASRLLPREGAPQQGGAPMVESLLENNNARRVLDSGENGQFTALALFSDAFRFALCDRIESLKRAAEQMQRQQSFSVIGDAFQLFGVTLLAHVSGRYGEALRYYKRACRRILQCEAEVIALPVSDALRYAVLFFPVVASAAGQRKGLWGSSLLPWLERIDSKLRQLEGRGSLRKSSMSMLFAAMAHYSRGETRGALTELDAALRESRVQKMALLECLSLSMMALFCAERKIARASEHLSSVHSTAGQYRWRLFERFALAVSRQHAIELPGLEQKSDSKSTFTTRGRSTQGGLTGLIRHLPELIECSEMPKLMQDASRLASRALGVSTAYFFLRDNQAARFEHELTFGEGSDEYSSPIVSVDEIRKWLPSTLEEHVKLIALDDVLGEASSRARGDGAASSHRLVHETSHEVHGAEPAAESEEFATVALDSPPAHAETEQATIGLVLSEAREGELPKPSKVDMNEVSSEPRRARFLILLAVSHQNELLGWIALPDSGRASARVGDMEQELMILGMHVGYLVVRNSGSLGWRSAGVSGVSEKTLVSSMNSQSQSQWPDWFRVESYGAGFGWPQIGWRVYGIHDHLFMSCVWRLDAPRERASRRLGELVARHTQLFAQSLRKQSERPRLVPVAERLIADFTAILGSISHWDATLDTVDMNFLLFDYHSRHAFEGVFGAELFSFSGESRVERESLHELQGVLGLDQSLFFRERQRVVNGHCGWAFGIDHQSKVALFRFADIDFMERYLPHVLDGQNLLPETLGVQSRGRSTQMLAVFALDPDALSLQQTGTGGRGSAASAPYTRLRRVRV